MSIRNLVAFFFIYVSVHVCSIPTLPASNTAKYKGSAYVLHISLLLIKLLFCFFADINFDR